MKKFLMCVMSLFLVVGFSSLASAVSDPVDSVLPSCEIVGADVEVYPIGAGIERMIGISVEMESGTKLPGMILVDIGVDGISDNGGCGMHDVPVVNCQTGTLKPGDLNKDCVAGVDVSIAIALDDQSDECTTAWCTGCKGKGGQCFKRNTPCCGIADCYVGSLSCEAGTNNCYLAGDVCDPQNPDCNGCFIMIEECTSTNPCNQGRLRGEWFAVRLSPVMMSEPYADRGRIDMPLPPQGGPDGEDVTELYFALPYRRIVTNVKALGSFLDEVAAEDHTNIEWQLHAWEDGDAGGCDYIDTTNPSYPTGCLAIVDIVPNEGLAAASAGTSAGYCDRLTYRGTECKRLSRNGRNMEPAACWSLTKGGQGGCEAGGCFWDAGKNMCLIDLCVGDSNLDGYCAGGDGAQVDRDFARDCQ